MSKRILFIVAGIVLAAAGIYVRATNAHEARIQADKIVAADTAGADTAPAIASLKDYAALHMGASVKFTLQGSYNRAKAAAEASAASASANSKIYAAAQAACAGKSDSITQAKCNQAYIAAHLSTAPTPAPVPAPALAAYQQSVKAPFWTPDLAGALFLGAALAVVLGFILDRSKGGKR